jgi:putative membrane protein
VSEAADAARDPRVYMAAERTFLAWIRTGLALTGFGFVVARFGLFLREARPVLDGVAPPHDSGLSLPLGIALIALGTIVTIVSALRHRRYVRAIDAGDFRVAYGSGFAVAIAVTLALVGVVMIVHLARM